MISENEFFKRLQDEFGTESVALLRCQKRELNVVFCRMIVVEYYLRCKMHPKDIAEILNKGRTTILCIRQRFQDEYKTNKKFREKVDRIFEE